MGYYETKPWVSSVMLLLNFGATVNWLGAGGVSTTQVVKIDQASLGAGGMLLLNDLNAPVAADLTAVGVAAGTAIGNALTQTAILAQIQAMGANAPQGQYTMSWTAAVHFQGDGASNDGLIEVGGRRLRLASGLPQVGGGDVQIAGGTAPSAAQIQAAAATAGTNIGTMLVANLAAIIALTLPP